MASVRFSHGHHQHHQKLASYINISPWNPVWLMTQLMTGFPEGTIYPKVFLLHIPSLKLRAKSTWKLKIWNTIVSFWKGRKISGAMLVSGSVVNSLIKPKNHLFFPTPLRCPHRWVTLLAIAKCGGWLHSKTWREFNFCPKMVDTSVLGSFASC